MMNTKEKERGSALLSFRHHARRKAGWCADMPSIKLLWVGMGKKGKVGKKEKQKNKKKKTEIGRNSGLFLFVLMYCFL